MDKTLDMLALIHSENMYIASLLAGLYPKTFVDESIVPKIEEYSRVYRQILDLEEEVGVTS